MKKYNAVVVGCGSIGALKEDKYDSPGDDEKILTMAHAFYTHNGFDLIGVIDIDFEKAKRASEKWKTLACSNINSINKRIDIVAVCIDTEVHYEYLKGLLEIWNKPKTVIVEKPFCKNVYQAQEIVNLYKANGVNLIVNYSRRFERNIKEYRDKFYRYEFGNIYGCRISYTRGLFRDGCHAVNLCSYFFQDFEWAKALPYPISDYSSGDETASFIMGFNKCDAVFMNAIDGRDYAIFEFDILTEDKRIIFQDYFKRILVYDKVPEPVYGDYDTMSSEYKVTDTGLYTMLLDVVDSAYKQLDEDITPPCTGEDALETSKILELLNYERSKIL